MRRFHDNDQGAIARRQSPQKCKGLGAKRHFTSAPLPRPQKYKVQREIFHNLHTSIKSCAYGQSPQNRGHFGCLGADWSYVH